MEDVLKCELSVVLHVAVMIRQQWWMEVRKTDELLTWRML